MAATTVCAADLPPVTPAEGSIVAGYPDEPAAWHPAFHQDAASIDLAALWGLPLYAYDHAGQLRPGLLRSAIVEEVSTTRRTVRLTLCPGEWSDGMPVVAADVVATIEALRTSPSPWLTAPVTTAVADGEDVVVTFEGAGGRWQHVLAELGPMLPAHVLADAGLDAYRDDVPVSGGSFQLTDVQPGESRTFGANAASPLGAPAQSDIQVVVVPRFELALGLLVEGRLDVSLGHLALEAGPRIDVVEDVDLDGAVARGNTVLSWQWNPGAAITSVDDRQDVQDGLDLTSFAEGLLEPEGSITRSFTTGVEGPPIPEPRRIANSLPELVVSAPRWHDLPSLVARGARDSLERRGMTIRTASDEADVIARQPLGDATIRIRRLGPWPSLSGLVGLDSAVGATATGPDAPARSKYDNCSAVANCSSVWHQSSLISDDSCLG